MGQLTKGMPVKPMPVTQIWISTGIASQDIKENKVNCVVDALLDQKGVAEVTYYSDIQVLCNISSETDAELFCEIKAIRSRVQSVFDMAVRKGYCAI